MAPREDLEGLVLVRAMGKVGLKQLLNGNRAIIAPQLAQELAPDGRVGAVAAADDNMEAFDGITLIIDSDPAADEADITDVMLGTGIGAACQVNVDRMLDLESRLNVLHDTGGRILGIGGGELTAAIAGACDEPGAHSARFPVKTDAFDARFGFFYPGLVNAREQKVLPNRQADIAVTQISRHTSEPTHLVCRHLAERQHNTDVVQPRLLLWMHADMRLPILLGTWRERARIAVDQPALQHFLDRGDEFLHAPSIQHVFQAGFAAVRAIALADKYAYNRVGYLCCLFRLDEDGGGARQLLVTRDATEHQSKPHTRWDRLLRRVGRLFDLNGLKADVVRVLECGDLPAAIEGHVEFARYAVK